MGSIGGTFTPKTFVQLIEMHQKDPNLINDRDFCSLVLANTSLLKQNIIESCLEWMMVYIDHMEKMKRMLETRKIWRREEREIEPKQEKSDRVKDHVLRIL